MIRPTEQEMIATEKMVYYSQFPGREGLPHHAGTHGEAPESIRSQRARRNWSFPRKEEVR